MRAVRGARRQAPFWARAVVEASGLWLRLEMQAIQALMALLCLLVLINIVTRYARMPIYWVDESAVYSVVWLTFVGASAMTRLRLDFAVGMLTERLSPRAARLCRVIATSAVVVFGVSLVAMCWLWLDPAGIAAAGFDAREYAASSFNFIYTERTQTLNWPTWILYLVMPLFALTLTLHGLANLCEDLDLVDKRPVPSFAGGSADAVN